MSSEKTALSSRVEENIAALKAIFGENSDLKIHPLRFGALLLVDGLVDNLFITEAILRPLKSWAPDDHPEPKTLAQEVLCAGELEATDALPKVITSLLSGHAVLLLENASKALLISAKGWEKRGVEEPQSESVVRGPREGFTESLRTNTALIRRKIKSASLRAEHMKVGRRTLTDVCVMYIKDIADPSVVKTLKDRLNALDVDAVLESGYLEEYIEDAPFSPFLTIGSTEKPDVAAGRLLEGRVAVVVDGTPFVLTLPMLFIESFQTAEDYYQRPLYASIVRVLRFLAFLITVFAPGIYIALITFHQEFIPTTLLLSIAKAREGTPFPVFIETLIMVFAFEILQEAGIRMPRPVGQAISIVGALIMGDAAVSAGLVGAPVVITVAFTAVSGFLVPSQRDAESMLRLVMMVLGAALGWYGVSMGFLAMLLYLGSLQSFGVPYFDGFTNRTSRQDALVRMPLWSMRFRPKEIARIDQTRTSRTFVPPPNTEEEEK